MAGTAPDQAKQLDTRLLVKVKNLESLTDIAAYRAWSFALINVFMQTDPRLPEWLAYARESIDALAPGEGDMALAGRIIWTGVSLCVGEAVTSLLEPVAIGNGWEAWRSFDIVLSCPLDYKAVDN